MAERTRATPLHRLLRNRAALAGLVVIGVYVALAVAAPWLAAYDPSQNDLALRLRPPSLHHLLGNDELGRDIASRLLWGARTSLAISVGAVAFAAAVGVPLGLAAGYYGGRLDALISGTVEVLMAFPGILLALAVVAIFGFGVFRLILAIGVYSVPTMAWLARGSTLDVAHMEYVDASRAMGGRNRRIMLRHILPNILTPIIVQGTLRLATAVLTAATLSFLGLGVQPPEPEWGAMIASSVAYIRVAPHATVIPGIALMLVVLGFNVAGDGLSESLDPAAARLG
ncbi:MAG TPA: ABC transporter permease [bacterium]|nr:ABC transporter permease [bacterium]